MGDIRKLVASLLLVGAIWPFQACWGAPAPAAAAGPNVMAADPNVIQWDPAIRHGVLPNGLRYAVIHNATPSGGVSIRLGIEVGSLDDPDDALGAAHFLEHMAFGGSHGQLQANVEATFAAAGVAFGRDRNAETELQRTLYKIDLPHGDPAALDLGFRWLRQVADGAELTPETVGRERGVIQSEREARLTDISQANERVTAFQVPGSALARGPAIGSRASIDAITAEQLRAFYDGWYRPENAIVIVVGDAPADDLEARVRTTFGSWAARGPAAARRPAALVDARRGLDVLALSRPSLPLALSVCRARDSGPAEPADISHLRSNLLSQLWTQIADTRLAALSRSPTSGLVVGKALVATIPGQQSFACLTGSATGGAWPRALSTFEQQSRLLAETAPSDDELEDAVKTARSVLRGAIDGRDTRQSDATADQILSAMLDQGVAPSPSEAMRTFDVALEDVTPQDVQAAFRRDWAGAGPLVAIISPEATPPAAEAVQQAWASGQAGPIASPAATPAAVWAYKAFGKPGKVVARQVVGDGAFVRLTFANGVRLNFKQTNFEQSGVQVRMVFGAGRRELAGVDYGLAQLASPILPRGGLGRDSYADISSLFAESGLAPTFGVQDDGFLLSSPTEASGLTDDLQLLAAYATDPGFRDLDPLLATLWSTGGPLVRSYPSLVLQETISDDVASGNPSTLSLVLARPTPTGQYLSGILKGPLTQAPIELTIVGAVDEKDAIAAVSSTFGALPARKDAPRGRADTWFLRFPDHAPPPINVFHDGPREKAAIGLVWPLYVADPARRREERALELLAAVYQEAVLRRIRGDLGKAYDPSVATSMPDGADQGFLIAQTLTSADDVSQVRDEMEKIAAAIARGEITDQEIDTVRKPLLARLEKAQQTNASWADVLQASSRHPTVVDDFRNASAMLASLTSADLRKAAADWLARDPIVITVTPRPVTAQGAANAQVNP